MDHGKVTPLHIHPDSDETMVVLEGEILLHLDGEEHAVGAGGIASAVRGVPHAFLVSGAAGARVLFLHTPGCCEAFYREQVDPLATTTTVRSAPGRWTWDAGRLRRRRTVASRSSGRHRSAYSHPPDPSRPEIAARAPTRSRSTNLAAVRSGRRRVCAGELGEEVVEGVAGGVDARRQCFSPAVFQVGDCLAGLVEQLPAFGRGEDELGSAVGRVGSAHQVAEPLEVVDESDTPGGRGSRARPER